MAKKKEMTKKDTEPQSFYWTVTPVTPLTFHMAESGFSRYGVAPSAARRGTVEWEMGKKSNTLDNGKSNRSCHIAVWYLKKLKGMRQPWSFCGAGYSTFLGVSSLFWNMGTITPALNKTLKRMPQWHVVRLLMERDHEYNRIIISFHTLRG